MSLLKDMYMTYVFALLLLGCATTVGVAALVLRGEVLGLLLTIPALVLTLLFWACVMDCIRLTRAHIDFERCRQ